MTKGLISPWQILSPVQRVSELNCCLSYFPFFFFFCFVLFCISSFFARALPALVRRSVGTLKTHFASVDTHLLHLSPGFVAWMSPLIGTDTKTMQGGWGRKKEKKKEKIKEGKIESLKTRIEESSEEVKKGKLDSISWSARVEMGGQGFVLCCGGRMQSRGVTPVDRPCWWTELVVSQYTLLFLF